MKSKLLPNIAQTVDIMPMHATCPYTVFGMRVLSLEPYFELNSYHIHVHHSARNSLVVTTPSSNRQPAPVKHTWNRNMKKKIAIDWGPTVFAMRIGLLIMLVPKVPLVASHTLFCPQHFIPIAPAGGDILGCIDPTTGMLTAVSAGGTLLRTNASTTLLPSCTPSAPPRLLMRNPIALQRNFSCGPSKYHLADALPLSIVDTWRAVIVPGTAGTRPSNNGAQYVIEWNTSLSSDATHYWTTEISDLFSAPGFGPDTTVWTGGTDGSRLEADSSSLNPELLSAFEGRTYYGRDQWSANGRGTVMLCSPRGGAACRKAEAKVSDPGWFLLEEYLLCPSPKCNTSDVR